MNKKVILGGIAGGIAFFLLGWLFYGTLLRDVFGEHMAEGAAAFGREMPDFLWLVIGNFSWGFLFALIFSWAGVADAASGAKTGALVGFLTSLGIDGVLHGTTTMFTTTFIFIDVLTFTVISLIVGVVVALVMRKV